MVVPLAGSGGQGTPVLVRLADGQVDRIAVRGQGVRTGAGLGVGSRLEELNAAYGQPCVAAGERGEVVVWYARQPGVSFVLDMPTPPSPDAVRQDPARLPGSARVRELFVRRGTDGC